jgi:hypothetical protein
MKSENLLTLISDLQSHIDQVASHQTGYEMQIQEIDYLINQKESALNEIVPAFELFLNEYQKTNPIKRDWQITLRAAKKYLENIG